MRYDSLLARDASGRSVILLKASPGGSPFRWFREVMGGCCIYISWAVKPSRMHEVQP